MLPHLAHARELCIWGGVMNICLESSWYFLGIWLAILVLVRPGEEAG